MCLFLLLDPVGGDSLYALSFSAPPSSSSLSLLLCAASGPNPRQGHPCIACFRCGASTCIPCKLVYDCCSPGAGAIDTVPLGGLVGDSIYLVPERVRKVAGRLKAWANLR
jgi:hypothetical protein